MRNFLKLTAMSLQSQMYYRTSFFLSGMGLHLSLIHI